MSLTRGQIQIDSTVLEAEPFEWPRSAWEILEVKLTLRTGWRWLTKSALDTLNGLYNGAQGSAVPGLTGLLVQFLAGTGSAPFTVTDWRGNTGSFVFSPGDGLKADEVQGAAEDDPSSGGHWTGTLRLVQTA